MRRVQGFDISFLITNFNLEAMRKHKLVDFMVQFMEEIDSEISSMQIQVNERARTVGYQFLKVSATHRPAAPRRPGYVSASHHLREAAIPALPPMPDRVRCQCVMQEFT